MAALRGLRESRCEQLFEHWLQARSKANSVERLSRRESLAYGEVAVSTEEPRSAFRQPRVMKLQRPEMGSKKVSP